MDAEEKIALFGGNFDPAGVHHQEIATAVRFYCDKVIVVPCGTRADREQSNTVSFHRARMIQMTFGDLSGVQIDLFDIDNECFTPAIELEERYRAEGEIWHVIGSDWIVGGREGESVIQREWHRGGELWETSRFVVVQRAGFGISMSALPPQHRVFMLGLRGSTTEIRERVAQGLPITGLVVPEVEGYIYEHGLYRKDLKEGKETE